MFIVKSTLPELVESKILFQECQSLSCFVKFILLCYYIFNVTLRLLCYNISNKRHKGLKMTIKIQKHKDLSTQNWYGTKLDSQMTFEKSWYGLSDEIKSYFEIGHNGGSYALNFDSKNLNVILKLLKKLGKLEVSYVKEKNMFSTEEITKKEYLSMKVKDERDDYTDMLTPYFHNAF